MSRFFTYKTVPDNVLYYDLMVYDQPIPKSREIKQWQKNLDLDITVDCLINTDELDKYIHPGCTVTLYLLWDSPVGQNGTSLQNCAYSKKYNPDDKDYSFKCCIPGDKIAGTLNISIVLAISDTQEMLTPSILATEKGSIIYEKTEQLHLEGGQALFPVKAIEFSHKPGIAKDSLYFLKRKFTDLDSNFNAAYTLYFNKEHPLFKRINSYVENDMASSYLLKMIMFDVYRTIVYDALDNEHGLVEFVESVDFDSASVKTVYSKILAEIKDKFFPEKDLDALKKMAHGSENDRNYLYTAIQDYIFGDDQ